MVANWLGFEIVSHGFLYENLMHFSDLCGYSKKDRWSLNITWFSTVCIIWNECNDCIFKLEEENLIRKLYV